MTDRQATFARWLTAATAYAKRGMPNGEEQAELQELWERVQALGYTPGECLAALEEKIREDSNGER